MKLDLIFAFASGQPDPIILPFLSNEIDCKQLILFVSEKTKAEQVDKNIARALKPRGIKVSTINLPSMAWESTEQVFKDTLKAYPDKSIAFNANGGTKPMTLLAYVHCFNEDIPVFYIEGNQLNWLFTANQHYEAITIENSLSIQGYFNSHGYNVLPEDEPLSSSSYIDLIDDWVSRKQQSGIGILNNIANKERVENLKVELKPEESNTASNVCEILDDLDRVGLITLKDDLVTFKSEEARFFCNGGWYELYILKLLQQINKEHFSGKGKVFSNLVIESTVNSSHISIKNEIDVAYLLKNRLYLFECKTANLSKHEDRVNEAIYKLGTTLKEFGGIHAKGFIMSYRKINKLDKQRATLLDLTIIDHMHNDGAMKNALFNCI